MSLSEVIRSDQITVDELARMQPRALVISPPLVGLSKLHQY